MYRSYEYEGCRPFPFLGNRDLMTGYGYDEYDFEPILVSAMLPIDFESTTLINTSSLTSIIIRNVFGVYDIPNGYFKIRVICKKKDGSTEVRFNQSAGKAGDVFVVDVSDSVLTSIVLIPYIGTSDMTIWRNESSLVEAIVVSAST